MAVKSLVEQRPQSPTPEAKAVLIEEEKEKKVNMLSIDYNLMAVALYVFCFDLCVNIQILSFTLAFIPASGLLLCPPGIFY